MKEKQKKAIKNTHLITLVLACFNFVVPPSIVPAIKLNSKINLLM